MQATGVFGGATDLAAVLVVARAFLTKPSALVKLWTSRVAACPSCRPASVAVGDE